MTDPRNYENFEYVRQGEALSSASLWTLGIGTAVVIASLVIVSYRRRLISGHYSSGRHVSNGGPFLWSIIAIAALVDVPHHAGVVHLSKTLTLCNFLPQIWQTISAPYRSIKVCFRYWPARPHFSHERRTISPGYSESEAWHRLL